VVRELFPDPRVKVQGSAAVDVSVARKDGKLLVNLVNTAGPHEDESQYVFDTIPPVGPLDVVVRLGEAPKSVTLEPAGLRLEATFQDGRARVRVPRVEIHEVVVIEER